MSNCDPPHCLSHLQTLKTPKGHPANEVWETLNLAKWISLRWKRARNRNMQQVSCLWYYLGLSLASRAVQREHYGLDRCSIPSKVRVRATDHSHSPHMHTTDMQQACRPLCLYSMHAHTQSTFTSWRLSPFITWNEPTFLRYTVNISSS